MISDEAPAFGDSVVATEQVAVPFADKAFDGPDLKDPVASQLIPLMAARVVFLAGALRP